jgi:hypothetical protein
MTVFRAVGLYPSYLSDPTFVGQLSFYGGPRDFVEQTIHAAEFKLFQVKNGDMKFGTPVVVPSFQAAYPDYTMAATISNLFFMNVLFSANVMETRDGKVSVFPVTVFTTEEAKKSGKGGFPCMVVHAAHFKTLIWRVYSATRKLVGNSVLTTQLAPYLCKYDSFLDEVFVTLSGFDVYNHNHQKPESGFMLLPAHWLDVMKHFFVEDGSTLRDIGVIFRQVYANIALLEGKFDDTFRCIWLGEERSANVMSMIKLPSLDHTFGMARLRAVDGKVRIGRNGMLWNLDKAGKKNELSQYNNESFAYGVQCWNTQLASLNTAYTFFTDQMVYEVSHQSGLLVLDTETPVLLREACLRRGICNDAEKGIINNHIRSDRHRITMKYGKTFIINYFGDQVQVFKKKHKEE